MKRFLPQFTIGLIIVLITVLHFLTPLDQVVWHEIYQRLYYIPIIAAALLYGLRGGLAASIFTTVVYSPHIFLHWQHGHFDYSINQYAEIVIFNLVGGVMGALGDRLKQAREKAEKTRRNARKPTTNCKKPLSSFSKPKNFHLLANFPPESFTRSAIRLRRSKEQSRFSKTNLLQTVRAANLPT